MINLRFLVAKLNRVSHAASGAATALCVSRRHFKVEIAHLLLALADSPESDAASLFSRYQLDAVRLAADLNRVLDETPSGNSGPTTLSPDLVQLLSSAWTLASLEFGSNTIRSGMLILALLETEDLRESVIRITAEFRKLSASTLRTQWFLALNPKESSHSETDSPGADPAVMPGAAPGVLTPALSRFAMDLTRAAREGRIDPVIGREREIRQIMDILTRRRQNNPILTGEAGVGKTAVVEGFALRLATGDVPPALHDVSLWSLDLGLLQAGAGVRGQFEERLKAVIAEATQPDRGIILFIDEAHTLIGGGAAGGHDAANLLKPALARGELRTIAATTYSEYRTWFEQDAALARRFQVIKVEEPSEAQAISMVRGVAAAAERHHGVRVLDEAVEAAVRLSHRYVAGRQLPDKAVTVLDTACAKVALAQTTTPPALEDCHRRIELLEQEIGALKRENEASGTHQHRLSELFNKLADAETLLADLEDRCRDERVLVSRLIALRKELESEPESQRSLFARGEFEEAARQLAAVQGDSPLIQPCVDERSVADVISGWTGIPVGQMVRDELNTVLNLPNLLGTRVVGQTQALEAIARRIRTARAGLEDPNRPTGVFLLAGPSGVGKTETALALADVLYGGERNAVVISMSEYQEAHSVSGLKGSPRGYVGYGEGGVLTEAVRRRPYCVLLLDEMEKAHPDVMELFYQVFDRGKMEDSQGREIDFRNTIILVTTNAGSLTIQRLCTMRNSPPAPEELQKELGPELRAIFKPALLGRMIVVPYYPIGGHVLRQIIELKLEKVGRRLQEAYRIAFAWTEAVVEFIAGHCLEIENGARSVDHFLTGALLPEISRRLLTALASEGGFERILVDVNPAGGIRYTIE